MGGLAGEEQRAPRRVLRHPRARDRRSALRDGGADSEDVEGDAALAELEARHLGAPRLGADEAAADVAERDCQPDSLRRALKLTVELENRRTQEDFGAKHKLCLSVFYIKCSYLYTMSF